MRRLENSVTQYLQIKGKIKLLLEKSLTKLNRCLEIISNRADDEITNKYHNLLFLLRLPHRGTPCL